MGWHCEWDQPAVSVHVKISYSLGFLDMFKYAISTKMEVLNLSLGGPNYSAFPFVKVLMARKVVLFVKVLLTQGRKDPCKWRQVKQISKIWGQFHAILVPRHSVQFTVKNCNRLLVSISLFRHLFFGA
ncbi:uncharacterized protein LOC113319554 isoform X1 [Papaver somniferum]|uniref:uncharacterized protein LOC113319554 isoform X1 n=1 Tax=Papaver somniferum TaxID=3469 RepID=UPI000E702E8E|nr:uncharacterized protein LOC113319554 isoform X1 [Papaver somniferum]XP_026423598.1 uncharacterized protein LOC113319554 isoform X1 [Papaver somniferum]XP_026423604.1 uncharacterized protein LOC113319554 isoform X1 [Papaver somniferum]XP_026423608.1 uncharacterized protein LOC113319554 isoform X1 [Papaver somniferum]XP_026423615.1 uncharacterized protein LOC113319554 isoform X1 [Papaver somniferum]XP_026423621.1 uncharacterized protein LOC113319554 isoform X1 [Papaver somniferum]